jgi:hypothetical protein
MCFLGGIMETEIKILKYISHKYDGNMTYLGCRLTILWSNKKFHNFPSEQFKIFLPIQCTVDCRV